MKKFKENTTKNVEGDVKENMNNETNRKIVDEL
jgi:hypothetical protein